MKKILVSLMAVAMLVGCSSDDSSSNAKNTDEYVFEVDGTVIEMNGDAKAVVEKLGDPANYFEEASCAFEGLDKSYTYSGFELKTYPMKDDDKVLEVVLKDDTVATKEGVSIGDDKAAMEKAYGSEYEEKGKSYTYTQGKSQLEFVYGDDDTISQITYIAITE